jgi:hypothetical protein
MISYSSTVIAILITCLILSSDGIISYFDGDRVGDFGLLYIPSIFFYGFAGMVLTIGLVAKKGRGKKLSQKTAKRDVAKSRRAS